jgi:hypothetical protein
MVGIPLTDVRLLLFAMGALSLGQEDVARSAVSQEALPSGLLGRSIGMVLSHSLIQAQAALEGFRTVVFPGDR